MISRKEIQRFRRCIYTYYKRHGRILPWRHVKDPYRVVVSELMLQQTQVARVKEKYISFLKRFPNFKILAKAPLREVLGLWQGLGYNRRAIYLKRIAEQVISCFHGKLPRDIETLEGFIGIGPGTAGAIVTYAFDKPSGFIETNIRSVFIHTFFRNRNKVSDKEILPFIEATLDHARPREWYYALTDYGVYLKKRFPNPGRKSSHHHIPKAFTSSFREVRGVVLKTVLKQNGISCVKLEKEIRFSRKKVKEALHVLQKEGFIRSHAGKFFAM